MASVWVTEYAELARDSMGQVIPVGKEPSITVQKLTIGVSSTASSAFNGKTKFIRLHGDAAFHFAIASTPTAANTDSRIAADASEYFGVIDGQKVAVIQT